MTALIVLVHGVGLDKTMWDGVIKAIGPDLGCHAVNMAGHGGTPRAETADLKGFVARLQAQIDTLGVPAVNLVGYSMGAMVAAAYAARNPGKVRRLVMMNAVHRRTLEISAAIGERLKAAETAGMDAVADAAVQRWFSNTFRSEHPEIIKSVRDTLLSNHHAAYLDAYRVFATADSGVADMLPTIPCPVLAVTAENDVNSTPAMSKAIAADVPDGRAEVLSGLAHGAPIEDPERVANVLCAFILSED